jgi:hypothetical protein
MSGPASQVRTTNHGPRPNAEVVQTGSGERLDSTLLLHVVVHQVPKECVDVVIAVVEVGLRIDCDEIVATSPRHHPRVAELE